MYRICTSLPPLPFFSVAAMATSFVRTPFEVLTAPHHRRMVQLQPARLLATHCGKARLAAALNGKDTHGSAEGLLQLGGHTSFELPPLYSRFPMKLHPELDSIRDECLSWGLSLLPPAFSHADAPNGPPQAFLNSRFDLIGAVFAPPSCSRRRLILNTKLNTFAFIFDDVIELVPPQKAAELLRVAKALLYCSGGDTMPAAAAAGGSHYASAAEAQMAAMVDRFRRDVLQEICGDVSPAFQARLEGTMYNWVCSQLPNLQIDSMEECVALRMGVGGGDAFLKMVEYCLEIDIEHQLTTIPIMEELKKHLINHYVWVNDLLSFRKEVLQNGDYRNSTVGVLIAQALKESPSMKTGEFDLQAVINKLWGMIQEEEAIIAVLVEDLKGQFPPSSDLVRYVNALCGILASHMYWYTASGRYGLWHVNFFHSKEEAGNAPPTPVSLLPDPALQTTMQSLFVPW